VGNQDRKQIAIKGEVAPGFEPVQRLFEQNMNTLEEANAQLCVYVGKDRVVDLWAAPAGTVDFDADTLVNIFSSGKSLEAVALAWLVAQGLLDYNAKIVEYWPEFGVNGKSDLTVADLMRHEAGLVAFDVSLDPSALLRENIKQNSVGGIIEQQTSRYPKKTGSRREYHAVTRGWIVNEVFRRVDPLRRTIGEWLQQEFAQPLQADAYIGVEEGALERIAPVVPVGFGFHLLQSCKPKMLQRRVQHNVFQIAAKLAPLLRGARNSTAVGAPPALKGLAIDAFNDPAIIRGETPSANTHASARGLARIAAVLANGGCWEGREYLHAKAWDAMHDAPIRSDMGLKTNFTQGGVAAFSATPADSSSIERALNQGREGFFGWMGLGGSVFQWHPEHQIGFAFVPTSLHVVDIVNERGKAYQAQVLDCLRSD
jgi:CubicO group peptidase (beta-lactamase class C family)